MSLRRTLQHIVDRMGIAAVTILIAGTALADPARLPREVTISEVEFVLIPEGWFYKTGGVHIGDQEGGGNVRVWLDSYYIAKFEARARDLERYLNSTAGKGHAPYGGDTESCSLRLGPNGRYALVRPGDDLPANHISWDLANDWARWMGFRLPSEAEWEKAARGGDQRIYPWGDDPPDETRANFGATSSCLLWPVKSVAKGRSPYGIYNMAGNVREYVADWRNPEADAKLVDGVRNPQSLHPFPDNPAKIMKGGRWASNLRELMVYYRNAGPADDPFNCNGTRFAVDVATVQQHLAKGTATVTVP